MLGRCSGTTLGLKALFKSLKVQKASPWPTLHLLFWINVLTAPLLTLWAHFLTYKFYNETSCIYQLPRGQSLEIYPSLTTCRMQRQQVRVLEWECFSGADEGLSLHGLSRRVIQGKCFQAAVEAIVVLLPHTEPRAPVFAIIILHQQHTSFCLQLRNNNYPSSSPNCSNLCALLLRRETRGERWICTCKWNESLRNQTQSEFAFASVEDYEHTCLTS